MAPRIHFGAVSDWYRGTVTVRSAHEILDLITAGLTQGGDETDTKASEEATGQEEWERNGSRLENDTEVEDPARSNQCPSTTNIVSEQRRGESTL